MGLVPGSDLTSPADGGAPERAGFYRIVPVLEVTSQLRDPLEGEVGIGVAAELAHRFFRFPDRGDVTVRITGSQQSSQLLPPLVVEPFLRLGQELGCPFLGDRSSRSRALAYNVVNCRELRRELAGGSSPVEVARPKVGVHIRGLVGVEDPLFALRTKAEVEELDVLETYSVSLQFAKGRWVGLE